MKSNDTRGYWAITWKQIRKKKLVMASLYFIVFLFVLATYAPPRCSAGKTMNLSGRRAHQ